MFTPRKQILKNITDRPPDYSGLLAKDPTLEVNVWENYAGRCHGSDDYYEIFIQTIFGEYVARFTELYSSVPCFVTKESKYRMDPEIYYKNKTNNKMKTLHNTDALAASKNVKDIIFWGDGDTFKLISKASSKKEGWMKSTKAMEIEGVGCVVQVSTQQVNNTGITIPEQNIDGSWKSPEECEKACTSSVAEAVTFVPGVKIKEELDSEGNVVSRKLEHLFK